jgi:hypothetical protein
VKLTRALEWAAIVVASLLVSGGAIALLSGFFAGRDTAGVSGASAVPGTAFADLGHAHLHGGQPHPRYDSDPPTSGAHVPAPVSRDRAQLNDDQLLQALELGDVVVMYGSPAPPPGLEALVRSVAYQFNPALAAAGQAVIFARRPGTQGLIALAWTHLLRVPDAGPLLHDFINYWLGRGAPRHL